MKTTFIYELIDPITNETRYIGKANNPLIRLMGHLTPNSLVKKTKKNNWIKSLLKRNLKPILNIIDEVPANTKIEWGFWERFYINLYKSWNCKLTNGTEGGDGGGQYWKGKKIPKDILIKRVKTRKDKGVPWNSKEMRLKASISHIGKKQSKKTRKKRSNSLKGRKISEETKLKISEKLKGRIFTEETKLKMSKASKGRKLSKEVIENLRKINTGKKRSEETKLKISKANSGKKHSEETKRKISEKKKGSIGTFTGRKHSEESIKKMKEAKLKTTKI